MTRFWQIFALVGAVLFIIILFSMVKKSDDTQESVVSGTQKQLNTDITTAVFTTNQGQFTIEFDHDKAPNTVSNFITLAQQTPGFFDGQRFHRVIEGFMIQAGDPNSKDVAKKALWGTGGPGYMFADEFSDLSNVAGTISMANAGPNTNGSQFFINVNDNIFLNGKHAVFGRVIAGMDVVMKISKVETDPSDKPLEDVIIEKIELK
jgi:peptidyl-prolyl cis-trans isomerase A (cyclophilin A)